MNCGKKFIPHRIDRHKFNLLDNKNISEYPKLVIPRGSDGDTLHAVTVVSEWIVDNNFDHALPLCQAAFDFICGKNCKIIGFEHGYIFHHLLGKHKKTCEKGKQMKKAKN